MLEDRFTGPSRERSKDVGRKNSSQRVGRTDPQTVEVTLIAVQFTGSTGNVSFT